MTFAQRLMQMTAAGYGWEDICVKLGVTDYTERQSVRAFVLRLRTDARVRVP